LQGVNNFVYKEDNNRLPTPGFFLMNEHTKVFSDQEIHQIWQDTCSSLRSQLSPAVFNTWILSNPLTNLVYSPTGSLQATITSPSAFHSTNIKKNLHLSIKQALDTIVGTTTEIAYIVGDINQNIQDKKKKKSSFQTLSDSLLASTQHSSHNLSQNSPNSQQNSSGAQLSQQGPQKTHPNFQAPHSPRVEELFSEETIHSVSQERERLSAQRVGLRQDFVFETFAVSTSNEMAHAAATAVSNNPGDSYNPLFLYGGVGVGKTHLMHAIGNNILHNNPGTKILYCTGEEFTNEIVRAIQSKKASAFKDRYRSVQVLLIDDVQFIAGKNAVQEEFFHTFNALTKQRFQVVLTSDRPPQEIHLLEARLRSRFEAGLMIDIQEPSFELRTAILLIKAKAEGLHIPIELAKTIASQVDSARKIEGIITKIRSEVELKNRELSPELIADVLKTEAPQRNQALKVSPTDVIRIVANHYHLKQTAIKGQRRVKNIVVARHVAMYLLKEELFLPLVEIGRWFSNRDHTSVIHAVRKVEKDMTLDETVRRDVSALRTTLIAISR
jgi:chromosomal replication initiator protein